MVLCHGARVVRRILERRGRGVLALINGFIARHVRSNVGGLRKTYGIPMFHGFYSSCGGGNGRRNLGSISRRGYGMK